MRTQRTLGKFVTDYDWDVAAALPVILQERTRELHCVRPPTPCQNVPVDLRAQTTYVYGLDLISATDQNGNQRYYFPDGLGSTVLTASDLAGGAAPSYKYDVFGQVRDGSVPTTPYWAPETFLFTGEQFDAKARHNAGGLYYLRARYYDQSIGRFLSQDPLVGSLRSPLTQNRYLYAENNPATLVDPYGLFGFKDIRKVAKKAVDVVVSNPKAIATAAQLVSGTVAVATCPAGFLANPVCSSALAVYAGATVVRISLAESREEKFAQIGVAFLGLFQPGWIRYPAILSGSVLDAMSEIHVAESPGKESRFQYPEQPFIS